MTHTTQPTRRLVLLAAAAGMWAACLGGCSSGDSSEPGIVEAIFGSSPNTASTPTQGGNQNEPMTILEKRRLVARLQRDPQVLQRLTPRERREVAAMVAATNGDDEDERD